MKIQCRYPTARNRVSTEDRSISTSNHRLTSTSTKSAPPSIFPGMTAACVYWIGWCWVGGPAGGTACVVGGPAGGAACVAGGGELIIFPIKVMQTGLLSVRMGWIGHLYLRKKAHKHSALDIFKISSEPGARIQVSHPFLVKSTPCMTALKPPVWLKRLNVPFLGPHVSVPWFLLANHVHTLHGPEQDGGLQLCVQWVIVYAKNPP